MVFDPRGEPVVSRAFRKPIDDGVVTSLTRELRSRARAGQRRGFVPNDPALSTAEPAANNVTVQWAPQLEGMPRAWDITHGDGALVAVRRSGARPRVTQASSTATQSTVLGPGPPPQWSMPGTMNSR